LVEINEAVSAFVLFFTIVKYKCCAIKPLMCKLDAIHKTGSTLHIAMPLEDQVMAAVNEHKNLVKFRCFVSEIFDCNTHNPIRSK